MKSFGCGNDNLSRLRMCLRVGCIVGLSSWGFQVSAAEWNIQPRLTVSETYTDNVRLGGGSGFGGFGGLGSGSEFITQISPGVNITGEGRRFKSNLSYTLNNLVYAKNERFRIRNLLNADTSAEIIKHHFFIDGRAAISQQNAFLFGSQALDNATLTGNLRNIYRWSISPYVRQRFSNLASGEVRYVHGEVSSNVNNFSNSSSDTAILSLNSGSAFKTLGWGINYSHTQIDRKYARPNLGRLQTIELERTTGMLRYAVTSQFNLIGTAGYERNSFISIRGRTSSPLWTVGFSWTPTKRTKIDASGGKRFFGNTYAASVDHRTRNTVWNLSYIEDISTFGQQSLAGGSILNASMLSQLFSGLQGGEALLNQGLPSSFADPNNFLTNRLFLLRRLQASLTINGKKNSLVFRGFNYSRKSFSSDEEDADLIGIGNAVLTRDTTQTGGNILWNYRLSPRTSANINLGYIRTSYDAVNLKDDNMIVRAGLNKQFTSHITGSIMYYHLQRESNRNNSSYDANAVTATLNMNF
ncbi:TIGR03016 family PEP-CTERM system-associated outer membrane protein [Nitrosomonas sp. H1_AOB3]|uniref:TIGR03016 family PEP-CTERM system-associated outer membrane protein n=1 Tax=Nitrosomonas sp. H1_AOB3 TaxID=2741553 RepID=UPI0019364165|nr:TIGR03016 family PEP-CTERM system-associated outer membrane protein [Nitrosomonas sp. H1_AOB3]QOJ08250.1 MAG: TIGR03016 family PEP-CTERM system-associated outer membrane protein [Nitrosomonas sp. H1_AOB3]